ncbi:hypothetical protein PCASD_18087 [Puccinia coronata f. sp. avenae]|uniref:Nuclear protein localization protein 4 n=1 Tax=Puccinia coronata f. sp. avenae TaxID=200324 RepID=A0A2N5T9B0_9BASI|nr:hypothetical protein PCASD_18087 [Puccinia coronata f. sp. avenae]
METAQDWLENQAMANTPADPDFPLSLYQLVRIRSPNGTHRYDISPTDDLDKLIAKILTDCPEAEPSTLALSNQPRGGEKLVSNISGSCSQLGIKHGDLLFASYKSKGETDLPAPVPSKNNTTDGDQLTKSSIPDPRKPSNQAWKDVKELKIDQILEKEDGKIPRKRDGKFCRHGDKSMCDYCMPLEPYDPSFHTERAIKHLSFQSFLRKLNAATNKPETGASYIPPLEELDYTVVIPCPSASHAPFPAGICSKCQPSAITLQLQPYRMIDHVEFATPALIENMLVFWRKTGCQRFGYMLGRYERYDQVPLGIKAVVEAIHEPPQQGELDGIHIGLPWEDERRVEELASLSGLHVVGMIFTDLTPDDSSEEAKAAGKVIYKRHAQSFFLSSLETIFAAHQQANRQNPSRFSASGKFSSKFVTCTITGNHEGGIDVTAYQASDQAVAMVKADMIEASVDPGTVRLKDDDQQAGEAPTRARYIPDVFYRYKNKYGIDIKENAKPCFPVDYLLVSLTHGFPDAPSPLFCTPTPFPIENRPGLHDQSMDIVTNKIRPVLDKFNQAFSSVQVSNNAKGKGKEQDSSDDHLSELQLYLSDWHFMSFIDTIGIFDRADIVHLIKFALCRDPERLHSTAQALFQTSSWQTLLAIVQESGAHSGATNGAGQSATGGAMDSGTHAESYPVSSIHHPNDVGLDDPQLSGESEQLNCPHCTFSNPVNTVDCSVCGLPLS